MAGGVVRGILPMGRGLSCWQAGEFRQKLFMKSENERKTGALFNQINLF